MKRIKCFFKQHRKRIVQDVKNYYRLKKTKRTLNKLLKWAERDLTTWLYYTGCKNLQELKEREDEIKMLSYHKYEDVMRQLDYIDNLKHRIRNLK